MELSLCSRCIARGIFTDIPRGKAWCRACRNAYSRQHRKRHRDLSPEQRLKAIARAKLHVYVKRGKVVKRPCERCGDPKAEGHHDDYSKPLDVRWLCRRCHMEHHRTVAA